MRNWTKNMRTTSTSTRTALMVSAVISSAMSVTGCGGASAAKPMRELADAKAAQRAAEEYNANEDPQAAYYLKLSREQLDEGAKLMDDGENEKALRLLERAHIDAELALAMAQRDRVKGQAQDNLRKTEELREEINRSSETDSMGTE